MAIEMRAMTTFTTSSSGLPVYRIQFLNTETGEPVSDVDVVTGADCVKYINENPIIKEGLGFKKGESVDTDLEKIVNALLYPYYPPEFVNIQNISAIQDYDTYITKDTKTVKEKGTTVKKFDLAVTVMAGSNILVRCSLIRFQNNTKEVIEDKQLRIMPGESSTLDFRVPAFSNDIEYYFEISDNKTIVQSVKLDYEFALPIYVGYAKHNLLDPALKNEKLNEYLNALITQTDRVEKRIVSINTPQRSFYDVVDTDEPLCPFILVPLRWNTMMEIEDINGMDITRFYGNNNYVLLDTNATNTDYEGYVLYVTRHPVDARYKTRYLREITYKFADDKSWKDSKTANQQTEVLTGFDVLTQTPIDSRFVKESYDDLAYISQPYEGLVVYIKNIQTYYRYNSNKAWEVTNNMTRFYSGKPSDTMGGKMDISIDIATGNIYQKNNSNVWVLMGNIRTGVTE